MTIKLIVGLGNPGAQYADTRHNAGFWFVETLAQKFGISLNFDKKFHGQVGRGTIYGQDVRLLLPETFMNRSGQAVAPLAKFYNVNADELLVAHDELDIAAGQIRLKTGGGHGGHNGLKDIVPHLGQDFHRLRIGIGRPAHSSQVSNFVLGKPSPDDRIGIDRAIECAVSALQDIIKGDLERARNQINGFKLPA
ncbi:aminoacyl-tRNA hydrolase [Moraxella sp. FZLJ2107]|uniref:aminoacyl-tRNA hydrolase n=1 Tax=unclassified Moraxella TaxID=2685852 RepID=UPI0020C89199|nr:MULTISPECIES: aminoacyl-tRNA hydrolase [unclassified Moraxella]UTO04087.1 aminoacyl-tRNA hydrolase [Moraxella sp. FZLJ2107]UTO22919.1 aminoacyl-tRNA hydrolase [Moraxella sp. FZLJ2109]